MGETKKGRFQYSLRTLMLAPVVVSVLAAATAWYLRLPPSSYTGWYMYASEEKLHFYVGAIEPVGWEPTVGFILRCDGSCESGQPWVSWLERDFEGVHINGRPISHRRGEFQLFVDNGSGYPVRVILEPADARKYFGGDGD